LLDTLGIQFNVLPIPPTPSTLEAQLKQYELWRKLIAYEKENTQRLSPEEHVKRVAYTYSISFLSLRFFPEIWYDAAMFQVAVTGGEEASIRLFERGIKVILSISSHLFFRVLFPHAFFLTTLIPCVFSLGQSRQSPPPTCSCKFL
jgi:hypothetical protein